MRGCLLFLAGILQSIGIFGQNGVDTLVISPKDFTRIDTIEYDTVTGRSQLLYFKNAGIIKRITFSEKGSVKEVIFYNDSNQITRYYSWHENGLPDQSYTFIRGHRLFGYSWYENGAVSSETVQCNDSIKTTSFYRSGVIREVRYEKDGRPVMARTYCENGVLISEVYWGRIYDYYEYYCDGKKRVRGPKNSGNFFCGSYEKWDESGDLMIIGQFSDSLHQAYLMSGVDGGLGQKVGTWRYFNAKGQVIKEEKYLEGCLIEVREYKRKKCSFTKAKVSQ